MDEEITRLQQAANNLLDFALERAQWLVDTHPMAVAASGGIVGLILLLRLTI